jgi:broad specificity phosphatase PhoE
MKNYNNLSEIDNNEKVALLIRHSDRDKIPANTFGNHVLLNEKGKFNAEKYGENLQKFKINKIFTSPVQRCVETAEFILKGLKKDLPIIQTKILGEPGAYISNEITAGQKYIELGFETWFQKMIANEKVEGMKSIAEGSIDFLNFLTENTTETGITIFVTHDNIIAFLDYHLRKKIYSKENWVNFLSGLILNF